MGRSVVPVARRPAVALPAPVGAGAGAKGLRAARWSGHRELLAVVGKRPAAVPSLRAEDRRWDLLVADLPDTTDRR